MAWRGTAWHGVARRVVTYAKRSPGPNPEVEEEKGVYSASKAGGGQCLGRSPHHRGTACRPRPSSCPPRRPGAAKKQAVDQPYYPPPQAEGDVGTWDIAKQEA